MDRTVVGRSVYDILNFLGDVGGLQGILGDFGGYLVSSAASFVGVGYFVSSMFYTRHATSQSLGKVDVDNEESVPDYEKAANVTRSGLLNGEKFKEEDLDALKRKIGRDFKNQHKIS